MKNKTKNLKRILAIALSVIMLLSVAPIGELAGLDLGLKLKADAVSGYSAGGAAKWAKDHWNDYNSVLLGTGYWNDGGDCANFVSQCLYMGGIDMDGYWNTNGYLAHWTEPYGWDYAGSFIRCVQLYNFLVYQKGGEVIHNPSASQVDIGDVLIYYRTEKGRYGHSAIVTDTAGGTPEIAYHSDGTQRDLTKDWHLGFSGNNTYLIKMHGSICVNQRTRSFDVYKATGGDLRLYWNSNTGSGVRRTFLSGEYAHVYSVKTENGYTWGYTFRYGDWGWIKLNGFQYTGHYSTPAVSHRFGDWQTVQVANCQQDGLDKRVCTRCGYTETRTTKGGHITDPHATCTTEGFCKICGEVTENVLGHIWDEGRVSKQPTCTEPGDMLYYCDRDRSHQYTDEGAVPAIGHDYQAVATAPTCVQDGITTYECTRCGDSYVDYINPDNTWSGWTEQTPAQVGLSGDKVRTTTQYRYRDKRFMDSSKDSLDDWILYDTTWVWGEYGPWSNWQRAEVVGSDSREVGTRNINRTEYNYSKYYGYSGGTEYNGPVKGTWNGVYCGNYTERGWSASPLSAYSTQYSNQYKAVYGGDGYFTLYGEAHNSWYNQVTRSVFDYKEYHYRDRSKIYTYHYYQWQNWSQWDEAEPEALDNREIESRTVYSYDLAALGHDFSVQQEQAFVDRDLLLTDEQVNDTCYTYGYTCSRCGAAAPDNVSTPHDIPDFETEREQYEIVSGDDASVTVYKGLCRNGCGCYVLKTIDNHNYVVKEIVPPTCNGEHGTEGYTVYRCTYHGEEYNADFVPALEDDYSHDVWEIQTTPTCTEAGLKICKCARYDACGHYITEEIPPLGHTMTAFEAKAATCLLDGNSEYYYCAGCDKYFADEEGTAEIEEDSWVIPATGHSKPEDVEWTVERERRCGFTGLERKYCENEWCDERFECDICDGHGVHGTVIDERETPAIAPNYYVYDVVDAEYDENYESDIEFDKWISTTCDHTGILYITCKNCEGTEYAHGWNIGTTYSTEEARPIDHILPVEVDDPEPLCIYPGVKHVNCDYCGKKDIEEPVEIPAPYSEHDMETRQDEGCIYHVCTRCGFSPDTDAHDYQRDTSRDKAPTCTEDGNEGYTCTRCGRQEDKTLPALGHDPAKVGSLPATCTEGEVDQYACQREGCDYTYDIETSQPLGHDYSGSYSVTKKATCLENGEKALLCCRVNHGVLCNTKLGVQTILARGQDGDHIWSEWTVVKPLSDYEDGLERRVCLNQNETEEYEACSAYETRPITGHKVTFMAKDKDGEYQVVDVVNYAEGATAVAEPQPISYDDRLIAYWPDYSEEFAKNEDFTVWAEYKSKASIPESDLETDKTVEYVKSNATVTLSAFAETLNAKAKLGAKPVDIVLVLDHSKSMVDYKMSDNRTTRYKALQDAAKAFVEKVSENANYNGVDHRIAIIAFNSKAYAYNNNAWKAITNSFKPSFISVLDGKDSILTTLEAPRQNSSGTCTDLGMAAAADLLDANSSRKQIVVLFTDGEPTSYSIDHQSGFSTAVANNAIQSAYSIKNNKNAKVPVYCIGVTDNADPGAEVNPNPSSTKDMLNTFLHAVSSNYPDATALTTIGDRTPSSEDNSYYVSASSSEELTGLFDSIVSEQVSNTITFQNITIEDTVSKYFTLTQQQESALRASLYENYGLTNDRITVTRNEDGTTTIRIENISPAKVEKDGKEGYGITVSYEVTANENALNESTYSAVVAPGETDENACIIKDGEVYAQFTLEELGSFQVNEPRFIIRYVVEGETIDIVDIDSTILQQEIEPPVFASMELAEGNVYVVSEQDTVINYTYLHDEHTVTWIVSDRSAVHRYNTGEIIRIPQVQVEDGYLFAGWDAEVPFRMGDSDLTFTAQFVEHSHDYYKTVSGSCPTGATITYTCACGHSFSEQLDPCDHTYMANVAYIEDAVYASITCSTCGEIYQEETAVKYQAAYAARDDVELFDLTLEEGSTPVQPDGTIIVKVALDKEELIRADRLNVYRVEESGMTEVLAVKDGAFVLLYLDHFSYYVITDQTADVPTYGETVCSFNGHSYVETVTPPTCTEAGYTTHTCPSCGDTFTDSEVPAKNHNYGAWTKLDNNQHQRVCANNPAHVEKANHTWDAGKITKEAKCEETGVRTYTCSVCKGTKTETISALGHTSPNGQGNCDRCGKHLKDVNTGNNTPAGACKYCGKVHTGPFGWLIKFFHSILAAFGLRK